MNGRNLPHQHLSHDISGKKYDKTTFRIIIAASQKGPLPIANKSEINNMKMGNLAVHKILNKTQNNT